MRKDFAKLHIRALPYTASSRRGERFVSFLYKIVETVGFINYVKREDRVVGIVSGIGKLILTLAVDPEWQRQGIGKELVGSLDGTLFVYTNAEGLGFYKKMNFRELVQFGKVIFLWRK